MRSCRIIMQLYWFWCWQCVWLCTCDSTLFQCIHESSTSAYVHSFSRSSGRRGVQKSPYFSLRFAPLTMSHDACLTCQRHIKSHIFYQLRSFLSGLCNKDRCCSVRPQGPHIYHPLISSDAQAWCVFTMGLSPVPFTGIFTHPSVTRIQYTTPEIVPKCFVSAPSREGGSLEGPWIRQGESRLHRSLSVTAANLNPTAAIDRMRLGTRV